jgi:hypothetical protein
MNTDWELISSRSKLPDVLVTLLVPTIGALVKYSVLATRRSPLSQATPVG